MRRLIKQISSSRSFYCHVFIVRSLWSLLQFIKPPASAVISFFEWLFFNSRKIEYSKNLQRRCKLQKGLLNSYFLFSISSFMMKLTSPKRGGKRRFTWSKNQPAPMKISWIKFLFPIFWFTLYYIYNASIRNVIVKQKWLFSSFLDDRFDYSLLNLDRTCLINCQMSIDIFVWLQ